MVNGEFSGSAKWTASSKSLGRSMNIDEKLILKGGNVVIASESIRISNASDPVLEADDCVLSCTYTITPINSAGQKI
jgi:hypothetical protein